MQKIYKLSFIVIAAFLITLPVAAQNSFFADAGENKTVGTTGERLIIPQKFRTSTANVNDLKNFLWSLPSENTVLYNRNQAPVIELPMPDGSMERFRVWESSIQEPGLAAKFPEMRTFAGQGIDDPYATIRLDYNPYFGFHAQILSAVKGRIYIDPYARYDINNYISYYTKDNHRTKSFTCETVATDDILNRTEATTAGPCRGTQLFTYRLALACTGEYAVAVAGTNPTVANVAAAMLTSVNRITGVYEKEISVRLVLVANNNTLINLDGASDVYTNNSGGAMLTQNQTNIDNLIGNGSYDIGHVFSTGGGGVAGLRVVCNSANKARGVTGSSFPVGDDFDLDYVAHEMGHQFGGNHTFNSNSGSCSGNRNSSTAYEVGAGTTIQGYAGICGSDNTQPHSDAFFHTVSFDEISNFLAGTGGPCAVSTATGNILPVITAMDNNGVSIPINTPFTLTGSATDANGDALTYCWEEWDLGTSGAWNNGATSTTAPLFKSRVPKTTGSRTFPDMAVILAGYPANPAATMGGLKGETLPGVARAIKFRLTVRDNRAGGGGVVTGGDGCQAGFTGMYQVNVVGTEPFTVTAPNGSESFTGCSSQTITWNVAGTNAAPFSVSDVKISLSTDGGLTYPTVLLASTPNDGSEVITIPTISTTTTARIKVEAIGNIFFDISNGNFTINESGFNFNSPAAATAVCPAPATMNVTLSTTALGGFSGAVALSATGAPVGTSVSFSPASVTPGGSTVVTLNGANTLLPGSYVITVTGNSSCGIRTRDITYTVTGGSGPAITAQPANQAVCAGGNTSFSITSAGATTFQWQLSTDGGTTYTNITNGGVYSNATTNTLNITGVTAGMNNYRYRASAFVPCGASSSNAGILTITPPPAVTTQPTDATICAGSNNTFTVAGTGSGLGYQWQLSTDGGTTYNNITNGGVYSGATTASLVITGATAAMNTYRYRVVLTGTCSPAANSNAATLSVISPAIVTTHPVAQVICSGGNTSFTVAGSSSQALIYQWQVSTDGGTTFTNLSNVSGYSGTTTPTLTITGGTTTFNNNRYRALLSNATCTAGTPSNAALLTVRQLPTVTLAAAPLTSLLPGQVTTLTASPSASTGGTVSLTWLYNGTAPTPAITGTTYVANVEKLGTYQVLISETFTSPALVCSNESAIVTINAAASSNLFIFPSPNDGRFTVSYFNSAGTSTKRKIAIFDSKGALVYNREFAVAGPYTLIPINMERVSRGIYYVVVGDANGSKLAERKVHIR